MDFDFKNNNFNLIRLLAALQVLLFHTVDHLHISAGLFNYLRIFPGVPIFFVISGFLISASYNAASSPSQYFKNRFLRIFPSLWLCLVIGLLSLYLTDNFYGDFQKIIIWLIAQVTFFQFYNHGVFNHYGTGVLNGSLWTISVELQFYFLLPIGYLLQRKYKLSKLFLLIIFLFFVAMIPIHNWLGFYKKLSPTLILMNVSILAYGMYFLIGILLQHNHDFIQRYLQSNFILLFLMFIIWSCIARKFGLNINGNHINIVSAILLALLTISLAYTPLLRMNFHVDLSYGIYIYHMLIINLLVNAGWIGSYLYAYFTIILTLIIAYFSWVLIEKPMLKLKNYSINFRKSPHFVGIFGYSKN